MSSFMIVFWALILFLIWIYASISKHFLFKKTVNRRIGWKTTITLGHISVQFFFSWCLCLQIKNHKIKLFSKNKIDLSWSFPSQWYNIVMNLCWSNKYMCCFLRYKKLAESVSVSHISVSNAVHLKILNYTNCIQ